MGINKWNGWRTLSGLWQGGACILWLLMVVVYEMVSLFFFVRPYLIWPFFSFRMAFSFLVFFFFLRWLCFRVGWVESRQMKSDVELDKTCLHVFMGHVYGPGIYSGTHYAVPCFP